MINRKFLHFNTEDAFNQVKNTIPYDSIVFIKDTRKIYTHGAYYLCLQEAKRDSDIYFIGGVTEVIYIPGEPFHEPQLNNPNRLPVTYTSSNPNVATVNESGVITVSENALDGQYTTITVTYPGDNTYEPKTVRYIFKINKKEPTFRWSSTGTADATVGIIPTGLPTIVGGDEFQFTYSSSRPEYVAINSVTGIVSAPTAISAGQSCIISATSKETPMYKAKTIGYELIIHSATKPEPNIYWSLNGQNYNNKTHTITVYTESNKYPTLINNVGVTVTYFADNGIEIDSTTGQITGIIPTIGYAVIGATAAENENYSSKTVTYNLKVNKKNSLVQWSASQVTLTEGEWSQNDLPKLVGQDQQYPEILDCDSSNKSVATVNDNGVITVRGTGSTVLTVQLDDIDNMYSLQTKSCILTINPKQQQLQDPNISWSSSSASATYGGTYNLPTLSNPNGVTITYTSSNTNVATINSNGAVTIKNQTGQTTITAKSTATNVYSSSIKTYTLSVTAQSQPQPSETFEVGYGYRMVGAANFVFNYKNVTTVAGEYEIEIPSGNGARLVISVPAKSNENEITKIEYNSILGKEDITSQFTRFVSGTKAYYWSSENRIFRPGTHKLVVS